MFYNRNLDFGLSVGYELHYIYKLWYKIKPRSHAITKHNEKYRMNPGLSSNIEAVDHQCQEVGGSHSAECTTAQTQISAATQSMSSLQSFSNRMNESMEKKHPVREHHHKRCINEEREKVDSSVCSRDD